MERLSTIRACVASLLTLGVVFVFTAGADANSGQLGAYMREGLSLERAQVALATQAQVEAAELPVRLEEVLGTSFAGVWFEPSTGKFCIGVVSGASRRAAEQVVAQTGIAGVVSYVSVRSTWTQLISGQGEWKAKLAHLGGQQFSTGLMASNNAVSVRLSSSVPEHERALLEHAAARFHVNVSIAVVPSEELVVHPRNSQCEYKPKEKYAYCSKPIAAGVLITPNLDNLELLLTYCTAGPLATLSNPATLAAELETLLITAGHCLEGTEKWFTSPHPGILLSEIGPTRKFLKDLFGDYGDIEVGPNWLEAGLTPALAQITNYQDNGLREARNVIGEVASVQNASFCKQGATSGEQCGTIQEVSTLGLFDKLPDVLLIHVEGLVRTNACGEPGDSGGPYATLPEGNSVRILGTEVGGPEETCSGLFCPVGKECISSYEPIKTSLTGLGLTLLTTTNQTRHNTCSGGSHFLFCTAPGNLPIIHEAILGKGNLSLLATTIGGVSAKFHCPSSDLTGKLELLGKFSGLILFLSCTEESPKSCKLKKSEIDANFTGVTESQKLATLTGAGTGTTFATLELENANGETCPVSGSLAVTGTQMIEIPNGATGEESQEIVARKSESNLKFGTQLASFSGTGHIHLGGANKGSKYLIMTGE